jgi:hypothetical protein
LSIEQVFKRTREAVKKESSDTQIPVEYSMLTGADVYLSSAIFASVKLTESNQYRAPSITNWPQRDLSNDDIVAARTKLTALGGKFDSSTFVNALENDDVTLMQALIESGWKVTLLDLLVPFDPLESKRLLRQWPESTMQYLANSNEQWKASALLCSNQSSRYLGQWREMLSKGYDASFFDNVRIMYSNSILDKTDFVKLRVFYTKICGKNSIAGF